MKSAICLLVCSFGISATAACADDWHSQANYPARAISISFGSDILDANHSVTFGSYTVAFAQPSPIIQHFVNAFGYSFGFASDQLTCTNALAGTRPCEMSFSPAGQGGVPNDHCSIMPTGFGQIPIPCPSDIAFQH